MTSNSGWCSRQRSAMPTVDAAGQNDIRDENVGSPLLAVRQRFESVGGLDHFESFVLQAFHHHFSDERIILDEEHAHDSSPTLIPEKQTADQDERSRGCPPTYQDIATMRNGDGRRTAS